jgi:hypothetical protein
MRQKSKYLGATICDRSQSIWEQQYATEVKSIWEQQYATEVKVFGSNNMRQFIACPRVHNANFCDIRPKKLTRRHSKLISGHKWIFKNPSLL